MTCENCNPNLNKTGLFKVTPDRLHCAVCGDLVIYQINPIDSPLASLISMQKWDQYFHTICIAVAYKSPCLSRKIGAILVRDHSIVSTGFNGPSRGIPHCGHDRLMRDPELARYFVTEDLHPSRINKECPRKICGYESGTHMELCPAQHAEENAISNAARLGVSVLGTTLYMNCVIPCKGCFGSLINAGIVEIVVDKDDVYDKHTQYLIDNSTIKIRRFEL